MMGCEFDRFAKGFSAWMTRSSELPDIPKGARPMVSEMPAAQSEAAGRGTAGRSPRGTHEQRRAGNPRVFLLRLRPYSLAA